MDISRFSILCAVYGIPPNIRVEVIVGIWYM